MAEPFPRRLTEPEEAMIRHLLTVDTPGVDALRAQVVVARATGGCGDGCPCASVALAVDPCHAPRSSAAAEYDREVVLCDAASRVGPPREVMLFVRDGLLSHLEVVDYDGVPSWVVPRPADCTPPTAYAEDGRMR